MSDFIRPNVSVEEIKANLARVTVEPLERGFGDTLGNSIRRVLLSSLEGAAVTAISIDGVQHEFSTIKGVYEDVTDIVLNVKKLVFKREVTSLLGNPEASLNFDGAGVVTGADLEVPAGFSLVNPDCVICHMDKGAHLAMRLYLGTGRGYVSEEANESLYEEAGNVTIGRIYVDSIYSPVVRCAKHVEPCRVGRKTDFDRLVLEVETNGAATPAEAVKEAANIINQHMDALMSIDVAESDSPKATSDDSIFAHDIDSDNIDLDRSIDALELTIRSYNCLKRADIHTLRELCDYSEQDLLHLRNFGVKSVEEVKDKLKSLGLNFKP